jgi:hypothetical protein
MLTLKRLVLIVYSVTLLHNVGKTDDNGDGDLMENASKALAVITSGNGTIVVSKLFGYLSLGLSNSIQIINISKCAIEWYIDNGIGSVLATNTTNLLSKLLTFVGSCKCFTLIIYL